jgi:hypothetical protein
VRPPLGLHLEAQGDGVPLTVALRPGWRKANKYDDRPTEPGVVRTERRAFDHLLEGERCPRSTSTRRRTASLQGSSPVSRPLNSRACRRPANAAARV